MPRKRGRSLPLLILSLLLLILSFFPMPLFGAPGWYKSQFNTGNPGNCGPTSVAMMVQFSTWRDVSVEEVRSVVGLRRKNGSTTMDELARAMRHYDVTFEDVDWGHVSAAQIDPLLRMGYKVLVLVDLDEIPARTNLGMGLGGHYFILSGVEGPTYRVQDPFNGPDVRFNRYLVTRAMVTTRMFLVSGPDPRELKEVPHPSMWEYCR